jgi:NAD+--dinitrogen-reductase ADP-D-ribosyltransferase
MVNPLGHSTNSVGVPTSQLGSTDFNENPCELQIGTTRKVNSQLFEMLEFSDSLADAADAFYKYMVAVYGIDPEQRTDTEEQQNGKTRPFRSSFLRLLIGWGSDSNGPEGALLKGWVESRFGLFPTFHKEIISEFSGPAWISYVEEKMSTRFHENSILSQLDILYEYCQWAMVRYATLGERHLTLYRGVNSWDGHQIVLPIDRSTAVVRLNNLVSFTADRDMADCFGETVLTVKVPVVKILFFNTLLPFYPLKGEGEYLVIGGEYLVHTNR